MTRIDAVRLAETMYELHRYALLRLAVLFVDSRAAAEDCVQDAFIALMSAQLSDEGAALAYLRRCVVNGGSSELRRRRTMRNKSHLLAPDDEPGADVTALGPIIMAAEHADLMAAVQRLPQRQRQVTVLAYYEQMPFGAIAETLGISIGTVKSTAADARKRLAKTLEHLR